MPQRQSVDMEGHSSAIIFLKILHPNTFVRANFCVHEITSALCWSQYNVHTYVHLPTYSTFCCKAVAVKCIDLHTCTRVGYYISECELYDNERMKENESLKNRLKSHKRKKRKKGRKE